MDPHLLAGLRGAGNRAQNWNTGRQLSTRTHAPPKKNMHAEHMLWSDPKNEPPKELRDLQEAFRRLGLFLALAMVVAMIVLGLR